MVEETLGGRPSSLRESVLAVEVFGRTDEFDPKLDAIVRVEMGRLRSELVEYYAADGRNDPVRIEVPKGGYQPGFTIRDTEADLERIAAAEAPHRSRRVAKYFIGPASICAAIAAGLF